MTSNPFTVLPAKFRLALYLILVVCALGFGAWQTADGNVLEAISGFVTALINLMAASNVDTSEE